MSLRFKLAFACLWLLPSIAALAQGTSSRPAVVWRSVVGLDGQPVTQLAAEGLKAVVLVFAATDCPISKRYIPEIARVEKEMSASGVAFWWVFPNPGDTAATVRQHAVEYSIRTATLIDTHQELVQMAHVSVTPEAAVFAVHDGALTEVYHGRIDDRYLSFGQERPEARRHDLEDAIHAVLSGQRVPPAGGGPVGCSIVPLSMKP